METTPSRALEVVPVRQGAPEEDVRGQAEGGDGLRKASETVALVCAGALAGGGAGMLAGVAAWQWAAARAARPQQGGKA